MLGPCAAELPGARSALRKRGRPPHLLSTQQRARSCCGTDSREALKVGLDSGLQAWRWGRAAWRGQGDVTAAPPPPGAGTAGQLSQGTVNTRAAACAFLTQACGC